MIKLTNEELINNVSKSIKDPKFYSWKKQKYQHLMIMSMSSIEDCKKSIGILEQELVKEKCLLKAAQDNLNKIYHHCHRRNYMVDQVVNANPPKWSKEQIIHLLETKDNAVERGLIRIYERQTADEKANGKTVSRNHLGFNAIDANYGTYLAKFVLNGNKLTGIHLVKARNLIMKYAGQLTEIANSKK